MSRRPQEAREAALRTLLDQLPRRSLGWAQHEKGQRAKPGYDML